MKIVVGKVLKAQGIKGELKAACYLDNSSQLKGIARLYLGMKPFDVKSLRCDGEFFYVLFDGICDRTTAESYRDWEIYAEKDSIRLPQGHYFIEDVVGCRVYLDNGAFVGTVKEVLQYGSADVYVAENDGKQLSFPMLADLLAEMNLENKTITLKNQRFQEVVLYDED